MKGVRNCLPAQLSALLAPEAYSHPVGEIRLIETQISWVLLTGQYAYKIKRPIVYPFLDMRSLERRRFLCEEELRLNRRFAPDLYLEVVPITCQAGRTSMGGQGEIIEHAVRMRQFDPGDELASLLAHRQVAPAELSGFGRDLAQIHQRLPGVGFGQSYGSLATVRGSLFDNLGQLRRLSARAGCDVETGTLAASMRSLLESSATTIEARRVAGRVKECHGDLHCRNVVRHEAPLVAFDCMEFEPAFRWIDVAEEIAFLFMDLVRRGGHAEAGAFLNGYLAESGDYEASRLVHLYGAHRALVRAKVSAIAASAVGGGAERERALKDHEAYLSCARYLLGAKRPALVLMSGFSGSGKTWLAERLAGALGAIHIRSDLERKRLGGLPPGASSGSAVGSGLYTEDMNDRTYRRLTECAASIVAGRFTAIMDATFQRRADRAHFAQLAIEQRVPIAMVRCRAPESVLRSRIVERARQAGNVSEADLAVLERQFALYEPVGPGEALPVVNADTTRVEVLSEVEATLKTLISGA